MLFPNYRSCVGLGALTTLRRIKDRGGEGRTVVDYLIEDLQLLLAYKLSSIKDGDKIMKKILSTFRKGPIDKMNYFFSLIGLSIGKKEQNAIALKNKMVHSYRDYSHEETANQNVAYTRIYELLFNRKLFTHLKAAIV